MELKVGYVCDRGLNPKRPVNQDRFLSVPERGLFAVFDGVGGQRAGEVASQTAAETIEEALSHPSDGAPSELVSRAIQFANRDIFEMAESDEAYRTMATTIALVRIDGDRAIIAHVGDSRVYRLEGGHFFRETIDHTDLNDARRGGAAGRDHVSTHGHNNVINRALGADREVEVEVKQIELRDGARFLLCSDGIYRHLSDEEIGRVIAENKDPQRAADELKRMVHERGADDNLTAVVVQAGRARVGPILALDGGSDHSQKERSSGERGEKLRGVLARPDRRIRVEFGEPDLQTESTVRGSSVLSGDVESYENRTRREGVPASRVLMYLLIGLVLIAASFYAGLRASDWRNAPASETAAADDAADGLRAGREAFDRGDYQSAGNEFESVLGRDPENATALYWLGRARLEQRDIAGAAKDFEATISREPRMFDAYIQAAAAYQLLGEKAKAAEMLARHTDERRKAERPVIDNHR
ncbi:MAG: protein phosphatase 2C domain-containing protein [Blastocatellia bacterium]